MAEQPYRIGDRVTVVSSTGAPIRAATVQTFGHEGLCVVMVDGSRWHAERNGRAWGCAKDQGCDGATIRPAQAGDPDNE